MRETMSETMGKIVINNLQYESFTVCAGLPILAEKSRAGIFKDFFY